MSVSSLAQLPARPPTPPASNSIAAGVENAISFLGTTIGSPRRTSLATPPQSSPTSQEDRPAKRLRFESYPSYCDDSQLEPSSDPRHSDPDAIQLSKARQALKSILKRTKSNPTPPQSAPDTRHGQIEVSRVQEFPSMLDDVLRQLDDPDVATKLVGYETLAQALRSFGRLRGSQSTNDHKASNGSPLRTRMLLLETCLKRDILDVSTEATVYQRSLSKQALKVASILFWDTDIINASTSSDLAGWLADNALHIASTTTDKATLKAHLNLFTLRAFGKAVLNATILSDALALTRIEIYQRLIELCPVLMLSKIRIWLPVIFHALLSNVSLVQKRAVTLGTKAANTFGTTPQAGQALRDCLEQRTSNDKSRFEHIEAHLYSMLQNGHNDEHVPDIWSFVIVFQRHGPLDIPTWPRWAAWQKLIQKCFNCSHSIVSIGAFHAWNCLIFAMSPGAAPRTIVHRALRQPVIGQLRRRDKTRSALRMKQAAFATYRMLLYYVCRPTTTLQSFDAIWKDYVAEVLPFSLSKSSQEEQEACQILAALLFDSPSQSWYLNLTMQNLEDPVKTTDLPRMNVKWTRKNAGLVLKMIEPFLRSDWSRANRDISQAPHFKVWEALLNAISEAGHKEIIVSTDLKSAIAEIAGVICRLRSECEITEGTSGTSRSRLYHQSWLLVQAAVAILGPGILVDEFLIPSSQPADAFSVSSKGQTASLEGLQSPLQIILKPYSVAQLQQHAVPYDMNLVDRVIAPCVHAVANARASCMLLQTFALCILETDHPDHSDAACQFWRSLTELAIENLENLSVPSERDQSQPNPCQSIPEWNGILAIIYAGLDKSARQDVRASEKLFNLLWKCVIQEVPVCDTLELLVKPVIKRLCSFINPGACCMALTVSLVNKVLQFPAEARSVTAAMTFNASDEQASQYVQGIWTWTLELLAAVLRSTAELDEEGFSRLLGCLCNLLTSHGSCLPLDSLQGPYSGIARMLTVVPRFAENRIISARMLDIWTQLLQLIWEKSKMHNHLRVTYEDLVYLGLQCRSAAIASASIKAWNAASEGEAGISCSNKLHRLLAILKESVKLNVAMPAGNHSAAVSTDLVHVSDIFPWLADFGHSALQLIEQAEALSEPGPTCDDFRVSPEPILGRFDPNPQTKQRADRQLENENHLQAEDWEAMQDSSDEDVSLEPPSSPLPEGSDPSEMLAEEGVMSALEDVPSSPPFVTYDDRPRSDNLGAEGTADVFVDAASKQLSGESPAPELHEDTGENLHQDHDRVAVAEHSGPELAKSYLSIAQADGYEEAAAAPGESGSKGLMEADQQSYPSAELVNAPAEDVVRATESSASEGTLIRPISHSPSRSKSPRVVIPCKRDHGADSSVVTPSTSQLRKVTRRRTPQEGSWSKKRSDARPRQVLFQYRQADNDDRLMEDSIEVTPPSQSQHTNQQSSQDKVRRRRLETNPQKVIRSTLSRKRNASNLETSGQSIETGAMNSFAEDSNLATSRKKRRLSVVSQLSQPRRAGLRSSQNAALEDVKRSEHAGTDGSARNYEVDFDSSAMPGRSASASLKQPSAEDPDGEGSSPSSSIFSSPTSLARNIAGRLRGLIRDASSLVLGSRDNERQRRELEDLGFGLQRALNDAGRRTE